MPEDPIPRRRRSSADTVPDRIVDPDLVDLIVDYVVRHEPHLQPRLEALKVDLRAEFGGQRWYVAARPETERQQRVREILSLFNGRNATEVARVLRISRATVYRVIKQPGRPLRAASAFRWPVDDEPGALPVVSLLPIGETPGQVGSSDGVHRE